MANRRTTLDSRYGKPVDYRKIKGLPILDDNGGGSAGPAGPKGDKGDTGATGPAGPGLPTGGTVGQVPSKVSGTDYDIEWKTLPVTSVFGRTGSVTPASGDYTAAQVGAEPAITAGTTAQYRRGDKTWQTLDKAAVGLGNVDDTSSAGTYVPTLTNVTNTGSSSAFTCQWMRVGNTITVSGRLQTTAATGGAASQLDVSLPVPSNFTDGSGMGGAGTAFSATGNVPVVIFTETANDRARFLFTPITGSPQAIGFVFTYIVQ